MMKKIILLVGFSISLQTFAWAQELPEDQVPAPKATDPTPGQTARRNGRAIDKDWYTTRDAIKKEYHDYQLNSKERDYVDYQLQVNLEAQSNAEKILAKDAEILANKDVLPAIRDSATKRDEKLNKNLDDLAAKETELRGKREALEKLIAIDPKTYTDEFDAEHKAAVKSIKDERIADDKIPRRFENRLNKNGLNGPKGRAKETAKAEEDFEATLSEEDFAKFKAYRKRHPATKIATTGDVASPSPDDKSDIQVKKTKRASKRKLDQNATTGTPVLTNNTTNTGTPGLTNNTTNTGTPGLTNNTSNTGTPGFTNNTSNTGTPGLTNNTTNTGTPGLTNNTTNTGTPGLTNNTTNTGTPDLTNTKTTADKCKDKAAVDLIKLLFAGDSAKGLKSNPRLLGEFLDLAAQHFIADMKADAQSQKSSEKSIEAYTRAHPEVADGASPELRTGLKNLYKQWGQEHDEAWYTGLRIYGGNDGIKYVGPSKNGGKKFDMRLQNGSASALLYGISQSASTHQSTVDDAATVWAVETLRKSLETDSPAYKIGKKEGNLMNFSTRVYHFAGNKMKDESNKLQSGHDDIAAAVEKAAKTLNADQLKCLLGDGYCSNTGVTPANVATMIGEIQPKLNKLVMDRKLSATDDKETTSLSIDPKGTKVTADGAIEIQVNVDSPAAATK